MHEEDADEGEETSFASRNHGLEEDWRHLSGGRQTEESSEDELGRLDIDLDRKSRRHNLTSGDVRAILHEVITHERVVDMMKAAIIATQDMPMFEPKMTRSRLKRAIQQGQRPDWSLSAERSLPRPHFVDIHLDYDDDSSDEEYCPDDDGDDDTAEETFLSDGDTVSPDKGPGCDPGSQGRWVPAAPLAADAPSFLERLNAVEEELNCGPAYPPLPADEEERDSGLAFRTRSKLRLVNVPLEQLEAELLAPDITADMYEPTPARKEEDRHWARWLHGLTAADDGEEADDDDDPEYNFLDDLDEPDLEDYRTDRAVQITRREVNELLEELFDTLRDQQRPVEEERPADGEEHEAGPNFNIPQPLCLAPPLADMLSTRRWAPRQHVPAAEHRRALRDATNHPWPAPPPAAAWLLPAPLCPTYAHKLRLQQQIQQHVQLLTQVHLLSRGVGVLQHEATLAKHFLEELRRFAERQEQLSRTSAFRACNLQGALDLFRELERRVDLPISPPAPPASRRWLPAMSLSTASFAFPVLPADIAWLLATRPVFLYPELLPVCSLDPSRHARPHRSMFTAGEDGLIVLGLKHFAGAVQPEHLISSYLLCKSAWKLSKHIREMSGPRAPRENVLKMFLAGRPVAPAPLACAPARPDEQRPPVERDPSAMPDWLKNSQEIIQKTRAPRYPPSLPRGCNLRLCPSRLKKTSRRPRASQRRLFTLAHNAALQPICPAERETAALPDSYFLPPSAASLHEKVGRRGTGGAGLGEPPCGGGPLEERRDQQGRQGAGEGRQGGEEGQRRDEQRGGQEDGPGEGDQAGDGEKDEDQEKEDDDEEDDEDFDELTQDEDEEEEAMSSASEESLLSISEIRETAKRPAAGGRPGADGESEEDRSQEEEEDEEAAAHAGERPAAASDDAAASNAAGEEETARGAARGGGRRGRGQRSRAAGGRRRARRGSNGSEARLLYDENMLENDPQRQSKDAAFARSYLNRVREALRHVPEKMEEFVLLLNDLERQEGREVVGVFRKLRAILGNRADLTCDFAAFLHPEQALECGLFQEQQAFERSRRFLRQLEITFGDNPSHYAKIIKALQPGPHLSPTGVDELKAQMAALLKGHPHLQAEFWVFFDELRPPPARPGQFEEAHWPEEAGGGAEVAEGDGRLSVGAADGAFEEVTLPDVDEDGPKTDGAINPPRGRKLRSAAACQESERPCRCRRSKSRARRRRGCARCHGNTSSGGASTAVTNLDSPDAREAAGQPSWERSFPSADDADGGKAESPPPKRKREEELHPTSCDGPPPPDLPVCAKNISVTPSGEKVILWTREADRIILTTCRQEGANQNTFQGISALLGNKTPGEVSRRFRDLMRLFQSAARHAGSDDEAQPSEPEAVEEGD